MYKNRNFEVTTGISAKHLNKNLIFWQGTNVPGWKKRDRFSYFDYVQFFMKMGEGAGEEILPQKICKQEYKIFV